MKINLPFLADGVEGGDVITVLVKVGDAVTEGQALLELETDKATVPVPAPAAGKISAVLVKEQDHIKVGQAIAELEGAGPQAKAPAPKSEGPETVAPLPPAPQPAPAEEAAYAKEVERRDVEASAARAAATPPAPSAQAAPAFAPSTMPKEKNEGATAGDVPAPPSVRRLARELGVELRQVKGSEAGGRITAEDVKAYVRERSRRLETSPGVKPGVVFTTLYGHERREPMPSLRRKIAANVGQAWSTIPHVHQFVDADITELVDLQKRFAKKFKERGANLTMTGLIIKAVTHALKTFPKFNASLDLASGEIIYKEYYNIGVAVDTPAGLIVPVIHSVDTKDLFQIAMELNDLAERTRNRQVKLEELRGSTFSVSNLGGIGGGAFTPIINPPEVAILGIGRGKVTPIFRDGKFVPRTILPMCVAYDHRLIDGSDGARFAIELAKILEDYEAMFLGL